MRSDSLRHDPARAAARAMLRATGLDGAALARPLVAVVNTWSEVTPCNIHLRELAGAVKAGVRAAGGSHSGQRTGPHAGPHQGGTDPERRHRHDGDGGGVCVLDYQPRP